MRPLVLALFAVFVVPLVYGSRDTTGFPQSSYLILMPNRLEKGQRFDIAIMIAPLPFPVNIRIFIDLSSVFFGTIMPGATLKVSIANKKFNPKKYRYTIRVIGTAKRSRFSGLFDQKTTIYKSYYNYKSPTAALFVQRDKPFYKPLDAIRFRCFGVNKNLMTMRNPLDIHLLDPRNNVIQIWYNRTSVTGVVSEKFRLSNKPLLGTWSLVITQHVTKLKKYDRFPVGEYTLPRILVTLTGDKYICHLGLPSFYLSNRYIDIFVNAKYGFGAAVKGKCILKFTVTGSQEISFQKVLPINGKLKYRFYLKEFFTQKCNSSVYTYAGMNSYFSLIVVATVIEEQTEYDMSSEPMRVNLVTAPIVIQSGYSFVVKPGLCNDVTIFIKRVDNTPLTWADVLKKLNVTLTNGTETYSMLVCIPLSGIVNIKLPHMYYNRMNIYYYGYYQNCTYTLRKTIYLNKFQAKHNFYMKASLMRTICYAGDFIRIRVQSTAQLRMVYYTVMKDNLFIDHGQKPAFNFYAILNIKSSQTWVPYVKVIITCITDQGYILVDIVLVKLNIDFKYQVNGGYNPTVNKVGAETILNIASAPESTVFIVAVDVRLEFMRKPTYISKPGILDSFKGRSSWITIPSYINTISSLLRWAQVSWISNYIQHPRNIVRHLKSSVASGRGGNPSIITPPNIPRQRFSDVWIWAEEKVGKLGLSQIGLRTPDSITTWPTHMFAVHPTRGVSVMEEPLKFLSFKKWFLVVDFPLFVYRNEMFIQEVRAFNGLLKSQLAKIVLRTPHLLFKNKPNRHVIIGSRSFATVRYGMRSTKVGNIPVRFDLLIRTNKKYQLVDSIIIILRVKPEGTPLFSNELYPIDMSNGPVIMNIKINIPNKNVVPQSISIVASLTESNKLIKVPKSLRVLRRRIESTRSDFGTFINLFDSKTKKIIRRIEKMKKGDIMGPTILGLGRLVRLPSGCGEQNMVLMAPSVSVYVYLKSRNALSKALEMKIIASVKAGYQNEMRYQLRDNGYSAFQTDKIGSTWLTAFVIKTFQLIIDSKMPVLIDQNKLKLSLFFVLSKQAGDGSFKELGRVIHTGMQGGASKGVPMTAYVAAMLPYMRKYEPNTVDARIKRAEKYLKQQNIHKMDVYTLCILFSTYVKLRNIVYAKKVEKVLLKKATKTKRFLFWAGDFDVEQTSYVLMAYGDLKQVNKGIKILAWVLSKRNSLGGYSNTQATVVALQGLASYALLLKQTSGASVKLATRGFIYRFPFISRKNLYNVYKKECPSFVRNLRVDGKGNGVVYLSIALQYNVYVVKKKDFGMAVTVQSTYNRHLIILICFTWRRKSPCGMFTASMNTPSGFGSQYIGCARGGNCLKSSEYKNGRIDLYLNQLYYNKTVYVKIVLRKTNLVFNKDATMYISTTDYYTGQSMINTLKPFQKNTI